MTHRSVGEILGDDPILLGALEVFTQNGFHGATVRNIARAAEVTMPTLYYHHQDKQGLLSAILERGVQEVNRHAGDCVPPGLTPVEQIANLVNAIVLHMTHNVDIARLDTEIRFLDPPHRLRYAEKRKRLQNLVTAAIQAGQDAKIFLSSVPAKPISRAILGQCTSIATWYKPSGRYSPEELAAIYTDLTLGALGARRGEEAHVA